MKSKLGNRANCYLIQNHGALALGPDLAKAKRCAELLEKTAHVYSLALSTGREVTLLPQNIQDLMGKIVTGKQDAEIKRKEEITAKACNDSPPPPSIGGQSACAT